MAQKVCRFIKGGNIRIFIDYPHRKPAFFRLLRPRLRLFPLKKLIVEVKLDYVPFTQQGIRRGAMPVHFNAAVSKRFIHGGSRQLARNTLHKA